MKKGNKLKSPTPATVPPAAVGEPLPSPDPVLPASLDPTTPEAGKQPRPMKTSSLLIAIAIVAGIVLVPLWLRSNQGASASGGSDRPVTTAAVSPAAAALPRFVDLGTTTCAPCKVMLGVMEELRRDYPGAMIVDFVNIKQDESAAERYGIRIIPAQIFYSPAGQELFRHTGVFRAEEIIAKWAELGFPMKAAAGR